MSLPALPAADRRDFDVIACGENSLDFVAVLAPGSAQAGKRHLTSFALHPGGQAATAATACARLGLRARYVGAFGDDEWGTRASASLAQAGVHVVAATRSGTPGRIAVVLVDQAGERTVLEYRHPDVQVAPADVAAEVITSAIKVARIGTGVEPFSLCAAFMVH